MLPVQIRAADPDPAAGQCPVMNRRGELSMKQKKNAAEGTLQVSVFAGSVKKRYFQPFRICYY